MNIHVGTNALNARKYVESAREEQKKEDNEKQEEEEWSSYPSPIPKNGNSKIPMKTPSYTIASNDDLYCDEPILDESFDMHAFFGKSYDSWVLTWGCLPGSITLVPLGVFEEAREDEEAQKHPKLSLGRICIRKGPVLRSQHCNIVIRSGLDST